MFEGSSLCVVGNINRDVKTSSVHAGEHLLSDGESSVSSISETIGGGGANSAFAAAALGARVSIVSKVGIDALGERLERTLAKYDIASYLAKDPAHQSGTSIALMLDNGHRHFVSCLPANEALSFEDIDLRALDGVQHLLRADVWFSEAMLFGGNARLFQAATERGIPASLDLNWDPQWGHATAAQIEARKQAWRDVLPLVSLAHGNVRELMEFTNAPDLDSALCSLTKWGAQAVVVHLGAQGAGYYHDGELLIEPPAPVRSLVNSAGTGDVLSVCLMLLHQRTEFPISECLCAANSIVAQFMEGSRSLIPTLAD
jgi:sugar/nucleoside kinase (ribokinase family)